LFAGVNSNNSEYEVVQCVIQTELNGDEKRWKEEMWEFEEIFFLRSLNEKFFI
jgi:hypothetical protein